MTDTSVDKDTSVKKGTSVEKCEGERHWISRVLATVGKRSRVAAPM